MADDGFHEIQLNGKQLVFVFMTGTVVAVVIFLAGVMVGRGIHTPRAGVTVEASAETATDPTAAAQPPLPPPAATPTDGTPVASQETLTYPDRLEDPTPVAETLRESSADASPVAVPPAEAAPPPAKVEAVATASVTTESRSGAKELAEPAGSGFVVQVAAVRERSEADAIARRLAAKGYPTFVTTPSNDAHVFRVRVGKYSDRKDADRVAGRLQKEEQFKPWITR